MKLAVMQPYFMPYIGYMQLIAAADTFVVYDNIKYTKKGWFNRNRMLRNGSDVMFSLPLTKGPDSLNVVERQISSDFKPEKLLAQFRGAYSNAPYFQETCPLIEKIFCFDGYNLFDFIYHSIVKTCRHLNIKTEIRISSHIAIDHGLKAQDKVIALCQATGADVYINPIGGVNLYQKGDFLGAGVELKFLKTKPIEYNQFGDPFVPWLSIIDVLMFNPHDVVIDFIYSKYELI